MPPLSDHAEPARTLHTSALSKVAFADVPTDLVEPALAVFRQLVENGTKPQPAHKRSVLAAGMHTMVAATRAVAPVAPHVSTALTAGIAASAVYSSHLLDTSTALLGRKTPADWTVGAELVTFFLASLDIVTGQTARALYEPATGVDVTPVPVG